MVPRGGDPGLPPPAERSRDRAHPRGYRGEPGRGSTPTPGGEGSEPPSPGRESLEEPPRCSSADGCRGCPPGERAWGSPEEGISGEQRRGTPLNPPGEGPGGPPGLRGWDARSAGGARGVAPGPGAAQASPAPRRSSQRGRAGSCRRPSASCCPRGWDSHTHTHKHPPQLNSISLSPSSFAPDHRQDAAFAAGDHRAPRHRAGAPLRLHHRQRKYGRSSGTGVAREGHTALFLFVAHFPAWLLAGNLCFPIAVLLAVGFGRFFFAQKTLPVFMLSDVTGGCSRVWQRMLSASPLVLGHGELLEPSSPSASFGSHQAASEHPNPLPCG